MSDYSELDKNRFKRQWEARRIKDGDAYPNDRREFTLALAFLFIGGAVLITILCVFWAYSASDPAHTPSQWQNRTRQIRP